MLTWLKKLINFCDIGIENQADKDEFSKTLRELVTILFAVVFATGLEQILDFHIADSFWLGISFWLFFLANLAVVLSWYGYNWGTINGPKEYNKLCYLVDCFLVVVYWLLLNKRNNFAFVLICYSLMFFLYFVWESIRICDKSPVNKNKVYKAFWINLGFFLLTLFVFIAYHYWAINFETDRLLNEGSYIIILFFVVGIYRISIHYAYRDKKPSKSCVEITKNQELLLIEKAKSASKNAKAHLSKYTVGAAILAKNGKIYVGCNIEFDNYSNTIHAEEAAISALISDGESKFDVIAVYTPGKKLEFPCGMCRQSLFELGGPNLKIIACNATEYETKSITQLLPAGFKL
jgi:cytidine deaminase